MKLEDLHVKQFAKTFNIPFPIPRVEYLDYFLNLLDPYYGTIKKFELYKSEMEKLNLSSIYDLTQSLRNQIHNDIIKQPDYERFNNFDMSKLELNKNVQKRDLYIQKNSDKYFLSIDFVKANFQSFCYKGFDLFNGAKSYNELIAQYTSSQLMLESKILRQILFGNLNPKRQQTIQKEMLGKVYAVLDNSGLFKNNIYALSSDELYVEVEGDFNNKLCLVEEVLKPLGMNIRLEHFKLVRPFKQDVYYKKFTHDDLVIKPILVSKRNLAQFIKLINNQPILEEDLLFINEDKKLSKSLETYFEKKFINIF